MSNELRPQPGPAPLPTPNPGLPRRQATDREREIMLIAQELLLNPAEEIAEYLWELLGLPEIVPNFNDTTGLPIETSVVDLLLSQEMLWIAEQDERMCKQCEECAEETFKMRELPPIHPNCRCGLTLAKELIDVTDVVMGKVRKGAREAFNNTANLVWFKGQVDHNAPWDIKRPDPWEDMLGIPYPGSIDTPIIFDNKTVTPEWLGNFTYGYLGLATGICDNLLNYGSIYAALPNFKGVDFAGFLAELLNELKDQVVADIGEEYFYKDLRSGVFLSEIIGVAKALFAIWVQERLPLL